MGWIEHRWVRIASVTEGRSREGTVVAISAVGVGFAVTPDVLPSRVERAEDSRRMTTSRAVAPKVNPRRLELSLLLNPAPCMKRTTIFGLPGHVLEAPSHR